MNFLAHIHIAVHCHSDVTGNLLGDFVKGDPEKHYPAEIVQGIRLHRFVDRYTDSHPFMLEAKQLFPRELRRFAPIALDVFWDHCLANRWDDFCDQPLSQFIADAENGVREKLEAAPDIGYPHQYQQVTERMWRNNWLGSYVRLEIIEIALRRMSERSPRMGKLEECFQPISQNYDKLLSIFIRLYPDILTESERFVANYSFE